MTNYARRRAALKGRIYSSLAILANDDTWDTWWEDADELGLSEATLASVQSEVHDELYKRSVRLPTMDEAVATLEGDR